MSLITYEDKVALNENPQVANINKVTANDMNQIKNAINNLFPVGFIISVDNAEFNPNTSWGGTWERLKGRVIVGVDEDDTDFNSSGQTGGEKEHTLTIDEIPPHDHNDGKLNEAITANNGGRSAVIVHKSESGTIPTTKTGGGQAHNNMPPYYTAYQWIKTAM